MGKREALLGIAVGMKGVGKTYATLEMIQSYLQDNPATGKKGRKVLILDVNNEYVDVKKDQNPNFAHVKAIHLDDIKKFTLSRTIEPRRVSVMKPEGGKMNLVELAEALHHILQNFQNGLLLIEDINRFISDSLPSDLMGSIVTQRHVSVDVITHFQSIGKAGHPQLWANCNWLRMHYCKGSVERHKNKFEDDTPPLKLLEKMVQIEYVNGNKRFYGYFDNDAGKIKGKFTKVQFQKAIFEYLQDDYNKVVKPLLTKKNLLTGKPIYDSPKDLTVSLIKEYTDKFYGN